MPQSIHMQRRILPHRMNNLSTKKKKQQPSFFQPEKIVHGQKGTFFGCLFR